MTATARNDGGSTVEPTGARRLVPVFAVALVFASAWIGVLAYGAAKLGPVERRAFVTDYDGRTLDDGLEILLVQSDGQAFATLARDPFLDSPESFRTAEEASYRAQRPLLGWLAWAGSLGRSGWVPPALAVLAALGTAAAVAGCGALLVHRGRSPWYALVVLVLPGTAGTLTYLGPEPLVLGLLAWGLVLWERERSWPAIACFALAILGRETAILVPATLGVLALRRRDLVVATRLLVVPATLVGWYAVLRIYIGAGPWEAGDGRIGPPFVGLFVAARDIWTDPAVQFALLAMPVLVVVAAVVLARRDILVVHVVVHAAFATLLGEYVWADVDFYSRVLLPMYAFGLVAVAGAMAPVSARSTPVTGTDRTSATGAVS